jgi:hypothetical protein
MNTHKEKVSSYRVITIITKRPDVFPFSENKLHINPERLKYKLSP